VRGRRKQPDSGERRRKRYSHLGFPLECDQQRPIADLTPSSRRNRDRSALAGAYAIPEINGDRSSGDLGSTATNRSVSLLVINLHTQNIPRSRFVIWIL
jgi:hypothetical protein